MGRFSILTCLLGVAGVAIALSPATAAPSCEPVVQAVNQARAAGDLARLARLSASSTDPASKCSDQAILCIRRSVALGYLQQASVRARAGARADELAEILRRGREFGAPWQLLVALGDTDFDRAHSGDKAAYAAAAHDYELAINDLVDESVCGEYGEPAAPTPNQVAVFYKKMEEAKLLAPTFDLVRTKDGECGGVFLQGVKGFEPTRTAVPVEFEYNATTFTAKGRQAAAGLLECVSPFPRIHLTGHTDKVGSDAFNMDLSARRLAAVKGFLVTGGFTGVIELEPKGKREPFVVDDPTQYREADIDQMNRRVELRGVKK
jgi:outer membrane protein OmpA-like peptidoglycan-associated protein